MGETKTREVTVVLHPRDVIVDRGLWQAVADLLRQAADKIDEAIRTGVEPWPHRVKKDGDNA